MYSKTKLLLFCLSAVFVQAAPVAQKASDRCATDGSITCSKDGSSWFICDHGELVSMGVVATGTICKGGAMVPANSPSDGNGEAIPPSIPTVTGTIGRPIIDESSVRDPVVATGIESSSAALTTTITTTKEMGVQQTSVIIVTADRPSSAAPAPIAVAAPTNVPSSGGIKITPEIILAIAPDSASCPAGSDGQCGTAQQAAPFITEAFAKYGINTVGEAAAILSLMAFESGNFKFNTNQFPGRPGQGTKAMLMPNFIITYAQTFGSTDDIQSGLNSGNIDAASSDVKNAVLARVLSDDRTYASAAWFYSEMCSGQIKSGLQAGSTSDAWAAYITQCVFTTVTDDRKSGFDRAVAALSGSS